MSICRSIGIHGKTLLCLFKSSSYTHRTGGTCRTARAYLIPSRPPWRTSHWSSFSSFSRTSTVMETPVSFMWRRATPSVWAHVSLTGATTWQKAEEIEDEEWWLGVVVGGDVYVVTLHMWQEVVQMFKLQRTNRKLPGSSGLFLSCFSSLSYCDFSAPVLPQWCGKNTKALCFLIYSRTVITRIRIVDTQL